MVEDCNLILSLQVLINNFRFKLHGQNKIITYLLKVSFSHVYSLQTNVCMSGLSVCALAVHPQNCALLSCHGLLHLEIVDC